ncbi:MAG: TetR/AcrR family transcriptional regulator [Solirubrobacteraceae bacterium]
MTKPTGTPSPHARSASREAALARQRLSLMVAMADVIGQGGYRTATVADVIGRAGVSRKTFYKHFANKQECFLSTYDLVAADAIRRVERAYQDAAGWPGRVEAAIHMLFQTAIDNPGAVRLITVEIGAVGPAGIKFRERSIVRYQRFISDAAKLAPGDGRISDIAARAVAGGLSSVLHRRVSAGERAELLGLVPDLVSWVTSYYPTPPAVARARAGDARARGPLTGGRAPGTLAPHSALNARRGLARGNHNVSRSFVVHSQRERILDAVANLTATRGFAALGIDDIAEEAAVSLNAFYEHFADKEDALLVAYELGHAKSLATVQQAYAAENQWRHAVRAGISALFHFLASEPAFAHVALVDAMTATPYTAKRSHAGVSDFAQLLLPGLAEMPESARPPAVMIEAIVGGIFELCLQHALRGTIHRLPELTAPATYLALAPFLGGPQAARVATKSPQR